MRGVGRALVRWVVPSISLLLAAAYVWAAVVWQANPPAIPIVGHSMQPNLWAGDLVVVRSVEPTNLQVGDVVTVRVSATDRATWGFPEYVTHRIVKIDRGAGGIRFHTRGDNNKADDPFLTRGPAIHGRQVLRVPKLGMVVLFFMSRQGLYSVAGIAMLGILWLLVGAFERRRIEEEDNEATLRAVLDEVRQVSGRRAPDAGAPAVALDGGPSSGGSLPVGSSAMPPAALPRRSAAVPSGVSAETGTGSGARSNSTEPTGAADVAVAVAASRSAHPSRAVRPQVTLPPLAIDVRGRSIIVTGATGRMGGAIARALHQGGARLTLTGRDPERLQELLEDLPGSLVVRADLLKGEMPEKLVARALRAHGEVHGLVNAASAAGDGELLGVSDAVLADVLSANVMLPLRLIRAVAPHLEAGGFICNLGARPPAVRGTGATVQATARATMTVMSSVLEWELAGRGVRMLDMLADTPSRPAVPVAAAATAVAAADDARVVDVAEVVDTVDVAAEPVAASDGAAGDGDAVAPPALRVVR